ncbi:MAG: DUF5696 domain-containing protein, partial [Candidatus Omnitrophica bacterium]|nr:DUF5696 domain-containing protein [Candidatus Omnitrophota bacterium]
MFLRFKTKEGKEFLAIRPFRLCLWDTPCQRQFFLENYNFILSYLGERGKSWRFRLFIPQAFLRIELECELQDNGFHFRIFPETLIEERPNLIKVMALDIIPEFFQAQYKQSGYFLLPAYCGAICRFDQKRVGESRAMVYSEQPRWEDFGTMPVCGFKTNGGAWLCILASGQFDARIITRSYWQDKKVVYACGPSFVFRHEPAETVSDELREARYFYFPGNQADYNEMAACYREYLMKTRGLVPISQRMRMKEYQSLKYAATSYH